MKLKSLNSCQNTYFFLFLFLQFSTFSQTIVSGTVKDKKTGETLPGALIISDRIGTNANSDGTYSLELPFGIRKIKASIIGYKTIETEIALKGKTYEGFDFNMEEDNVQLNPMVITSSRFERPLNESPVSLEVIRPDMAVKLNTFSTKDLLDRVSGLQIIDGQANIRGGSGYSYGAGSRVLLVMDDLPILQPDAGFPNWDDLPLENVGQIEILKGAASALYGSSAMNGIIHFRSTSPGSDRYQAITISPRFFFEPKNKNHWWGSDDRNIIPSEIFVNYIRREKIKSWDYSVGLQYANKTGYNKAADSENSHFNLNVRKRFSARFTGTLGFNGNFGTSSNFFYWKDNGSFEGDPTSASHSEKTRFSIDPGLQYFTTKNYKHKLITRWYHITNNNDNNQSNTSENFYSEYQLQKEISKIHLSWTGGAVANGNIVNANLYGDTTFKGLNLAAYLQLEQVLFSKLILSAGFRYEYYRNQGPSHIGGQAVNPISKEDKPVLRFALNYQMIPSTYFRASWGQGFRFPTLAEKYISTNAGSFKIIPNPLLESEYGETFEIGVKQIFDFSEAKGIVDFSIFRSLYDNMIEFNLPATGLFFFQAQNVGGTDIKGFEITWQSIWSRGNSKFILGGGYTYLDPKFQEWDILGKKLPLNVVINDTISQGELNALRTTSNINLLKYRSKHLARLDLQWEYKKSFLGMGFNYVSNVSSIDPLFEGFVHGLQDYRRAHNHGYRVYDFRMGYRFDKFKIQANLNNVFNEDYSIRVGLMEAPRNLSLRSSFEF